MPALTGEGLHLAMSAVEREESEGVGNLADDGAGRARVAQVERGASEEREPSHPFCVRAACAEGTPQRR